MSEISHIIVTPHVRNFQTYRLTVTCVLYASEVTYMWFYLFAIVQVHGPFEAKKTVRHISASHFLTPDLDMSLHLFFIDQAEYIYI